MSKPFIYGMSVDGNHFTDRELETKRLQLNFENADARRSHSRLYSLSFTGLFRYSTPKTNRFSGINSFLFQF